MKKLLTILLIFFTVIGKAQTVDTIHVPLRRVDLTPYLLKTDTTSKWVNTIANNATHDSLIYFIGPTRYAVKTYGSGSQVIDTTAQSGVLKGSGNHIVSAVAGTDYVIPSTLNGKLNISDTSSMLSKYLRSSDAVATYVPKTTTVNGYPLSSNVTLTKSDVGLGNVDNTSDVNKPISTATQTALNLKQNTISNLGDTSKYAKSGIGSSPYLQKAIGANTLGNSNIKDSAGITMTPDTIKGIASGIGVNIQQVWTTSSSSPTLINANATGSSGGVLMNLLYNGSSMFKLLTGGNATFGNSVTSAGSFLGAKFSASGGSTASPIYKSAVTFSTTSGSSYGYQDNNNLTDSTGSSAYAAFAFTGNINQGFNGTGTATGITRGVYINPGLTNPHDWRSIETNNSLGYGFYQGGGAKNYFSGNTGYGVLNPVALVGIAGGTTTVPSQIINPGVKLTSPKIGALENDSVSNHYYWTDNSTTRRQLDQQFVDTVSTTAALMAFSNPTRMVYLNDTLQRGAFYWTNTPQTPFTGMIVSATGKGSGYWIRIYDNSKGVNVDWFGGRDQTAIANAITYAGVNGIINFTPNKIYTQNGRLLPKVNQLFNGNNATLRRNADSVVTLTAASNVTDFTITVNAVPSNWSSLNGYIQLYSDTTDFSSSTLLSISSISGNTVTFSSAIGGLYNPDATHTQITSWPIGTKAHLVFSQMEDNGNAISFSVSNLTFDGNKANNNGNYSWRINTAISEKGNEGQATIKNCSFINMPNENIMGHGLKIIGNWAHNLNGSFVHLSATYGNNPPQIPTIIEGNITDSTNQIQSIVTAHSEGAITYSNTSGYVTISGNRFKNGNDGVFGVIQSGNSTNGGVRNMLITGNYAENFNSIFYGNIADPTGLTFKQGHIDVHGNLFNACGTTDWSSYQSNIDKSDTILIGNNTLVGGTVWKIPVQKADTLQRYILNNPSTTPQGADINITGNIKGKAATFSAISTSVTPTSTDSSNKIATTAFVKQFGTTNVKLPMQWDSATNTLEINPDTLALWQSQRRPYKTYVATITQSGTSAPVATVLENNTGFTFTYTYTGVGWYTLDCSGSAFAKAYVVTQNKSFTPMSLFEWNLTSGTEISLHVRKTDGTSVDASLDGIIEIRVYP